MKTLYLLAGCNGAGKTTAAFTLLPGLLGCREFVNADEIARGLSPFRPETVSIQAGRLMLARLHELLGAGETLALETTLATRIYLPIVAKARAQGYVIRLLFFWLNAPDLAVRRVAARVREGGHNIPEPTIRRRYEGGVGQFFGAYRTAVDDWLLFDNSNGAGALIAAGDASATTVAKPDIWHQLTPPTTAAPKAAALETAQFGSQVQLSLAEAYNAMLAFKKYKQSPVIISRAGQIVAVPPEDMPPAPLPPQP